MSVYTYHNQLSENWQLRETLSINTNCQNFPGLIFSLQISLARAPCLFSSIIYLSCSVATLTLGSSISRTHFYQLWDWITRKRIRQIFFNFFTSTSNEVIIVPSKFNRHLNLSSCFSANFPCQIQGASYPFRVKVGDFQN